MKTKSLLLIVLIFSFGSGIMHAQDKKKAVAGKSITWYGVDFTLGRFCLCCNERMAEIDPVNPF